MIEEIARLGKRNKRKFLRCKQAFKVIKNVSKTSEGEHFIQRTWDMQEARKHKHAWHIWTQVAGND